MVNVSRNSKIQRLDNNSASLDGKAEFKVAASRSALEVEAPEKLLETQNSPHQVKFKRQEGGSSLGVTNETAEDARLDTKLSMGYRRTAKPPLTMGKQDSIMSTSKRSAMDGIPPY